MVALAPRLAAIREELPVFERLAYLNTGTAGPLPRRTTQAIISRTEAQLRDGRSNFKVFMSEYFPMLDELRSRFARVLGAGADEIALTHHTTEGMNVAIWGLNWRPGDEIVTTSEEHDGASLPVFQAARRQGLTLRVVEAGADDTMIVERITAALTPRTRLVVVSHVFFKTGTVLPLAEIAAAAHRVGALLAVDGAQSAGAIPIDARALDVDFYAIPGQKWLCGPEGVGALYVRRERVPELSPTFIGFFSLRDFTAYDTSGYFIPAPGARRYEVGTVFWPALGGMLESLRWLQDTLGYDAIYHQCAAITRRGRELLAAVPGLTIYSPARHAGLTSFSVDGLEPIATAQALAERGVVIRSVHDPDLLRVSTGFYNDESDVARLCEGLVDLRKGAG
jgi:L-cysteine/cystine lyase